MDCCMCGEHVSSEAFWVSATHVLHTDCLNEVRRIAGDRRQFPTVVL